MTSLDPDFPSWPKRAINGDYTRLAAEHGLRVASIIRDNKWSYEGAKKKWQAEQLAIMVDFADGLVREGYQKRPAANTMLSSYRRALHGIEAVETKG